MVYSIPAQPPFLTPIRRADRGLSERAMRARIRAAAASVSRITWGRGRACTMISVLFLDSGLLPHIEGDAGLIRHAAGIPRRIEHQIDLHVLDPRNRADRILDPARHVAR